MFYVGNAFSLRWTAATCIYWREGSALQVIIELSSCMHLLISTILAFEKCVFKVSIALKESSNAVQML